MKKLVHKGITYEIVRFNYNQVVLKITGITLDEDDEGYRYENIGNFDSLKDWVEDLTGDRL